MPEPAASDTADALLLRPVARVRSRFPSKFGIPRQSGLVPGLRAEVVFEPHFRTPDALRGLEGFSHLWLLWGFSANPRGSAWSPTVRPPRLGGNARLGVFATRSPRRPNPVGLSCVRLERIDPSSPHGPVLHVLGADLLDGTPVYDIKPYLPYADAVPDAAAGFAADPPDPDALDVDIPPALLACIPETERATVRALLAADPRPAYLHDASRVHGLAYAGLDIRFRVDGRRLSVVGIHPAPAP